MDAEGPDVPDRPFPFARGPPICWRMRQILFVFAILGAALSGWVPVAAAALHGAQPSGLHAMHTSGSDEAGGDHDTSKRAAHPLACSACFAIEAVRIEPAARSVGVSDRLSAVVPQLAGLAHRPLDPPPRS